MMGKQRKFRPGFVAHILSHIVSVNKSLALVNRVYQVKNPSFTSGKCAWDN